jgi:hypothetical protein
MVNIAKGARIIKNLENAIHIVNLSSHWAVDDTAPNGHTDFII